ncbi:MAG: cell surface protein [Alphaproteobacteria bacterium]
MATSLMQYLDKAIGTLDELGLIPEKQEEAPVLALLQKIEELDQDKITLIARTLSQASLFNEVVREQVKEMQYGERYKAITAMFDSIRDDARSMVKQVEDGKIDTFERLANLWMKTTRGDIPKRFQTIKSTYLDVSKDTKDQIERELLILEAYKDFRGAMKQSEVLALEVLAIAEQRLEQVKEVLDSASKDITDYKGEDAAEVAKLELIRDEKLRALQAEDARYQIAKDLSDNLTVGYNTSEVVMARLNQTTSAKQRIYAQSVSFFSTNETVLTALSASFTGLHGLHESTQTLNAMTEGIEKSLETLAEIGNVVQEEALRAGYGPTVRAESVKTLVNAVVEYQERSIDIIDEMRKLSTQNAKEIQEAVEDGKRRMANLSKRSAHAIALAA